MSPWASWLRVSSERRTAVLGARGHAAHYTTKVQRATHKRVPHTRHILHTAAPHQHHAVLLQVVALARDIRRHQTTVRQAHTRHLADRRVRFLRLRRKDLRAHALHKRTPFQRRHTIHRRAVGAPRAAHRLLQRHLPHRRRAQRTHRRHRQRRAHSLLCRIDARRRPQRGPTAHARHPHRQREGVFAPAAPTNHVY